MDINTQNQFNLVATKLYKAFLAGTEYGVNQPRWVFTWDKDLPIAENLVNVVAEDKALNTLTIAGIIDSESLNNTYRDMLIKYPEEPAPTGYSSVLGDLDNPAPDLLEYDRFRFIYSFNYEKFLQFCSEHDLNYKDDTILAKLEIINQIPVVHVRNYSFKLKSLQAGSTLDIIQAASDHKDIRFGFIQLHQWTGKSFASQARFSSIFRKGKNVFCENGLLSPFAEITPQTFQLKEHANLTPSQFSAIKKASTN